MSFSSFRFRASAVKQLCGNSYLRNFSVKEVSWCASSESPNRRKPKGKQNNGDDDKKDRNETHERTNELNPIERFGIVAAMAKGSNVIGMNGKLPWNLPEERELFKTLTKNKILILGRRTFEEEMDQCHISHCVHSIIVSKTLKLTESSPEGNLLHVVPSFHEALHVARSLATTLDVGSSDNSNDLMCWVAGGERLYQDALQHRSAERVHLTLIDKALSLSGLDYARFPSRYHWDNKFRIVSRENHVSKEGDIGLTFETLVYKRIRSKR